MKRWLRSWGPKRAVEFIIEIRECYWDSVVELRGATEKLSIAQIEAEIKKTKSKKAN